MGEAQTKAPGTSKERTDPIAEERDGILRRFRRSGDVEASLRALSALTDRLVIQAAGRFLPESTMAAATGGYGRREMFPGSDIDLLILKDDDVPEDRIKSFLHFFWDQGLHLGHQVCSVSQLKSLCVDDLELILSLLDARPLAGDRRLIAAFRLEVDEWARRNRTDLCRGIAQLAALRHRSFAGTIYHQEPDLKVGPGGLRDYWMAERLRDLGDKAPSAASDIDIERARLFIARLRFWVHLSKSGRRNRLTYALQDTIAEGMGFGSGVSAVESLMNAYFLAARALHSYCLRQMALAWGRNDQLSDLPAARLKGAEDVLALFEDCGVKGRPLSEQERKAVVGALPDFAATLDSESSRARLRGLLRPKPGSYRTLSQMYELGVLEVLIPEFSGIKAKVVRDFYHRFTVDEHSLQAIRNIERLLDGKDPAASESGAAPPASGQTTDERPAGEGLLREEGRYPQPVPLTPPQSNGARERSGDLPAPPADNRYRTLLEELDSPEILTLALLLHDMGKGRGGDHAEESARLAARSLKRLRFEASIVDRTVALVRDHLAMSGAVFRRDFNDPRTIERFAVRMPDAEQLKLLCLLTYADVGAVAPGILTDWKKDLLFQFYVAVYNRLTLGYGQERIERSSIGARLVRRLPAEFSRREFKDFLQGFPRRYLTSTSEDEIHQHFRMASRLSQAAPLQARLTRMRNSWELCVLTYDRERLFAQIAGVLACFDMNVLRGFAFANRSSIVLDLFRFEDTRSRFQEGSDDRERFLRTLDDVVEGRRSLGDLLRGREGEALRRRPASAVVPSARFGEGQGESYSILEVIAPDSIGLLHRVARTIAQAGCNIDLALIATEGAKAIDVFYLSRDGQALDDEARRLLPQQILDNLREVS